VTSFVGVSANRRDDVRAAGARHLHRVASYSAGRAHHNEALIRGDAQQLEDPSAAIAATGSAAACSSATPSGKSESQILR